MLPNFLLIGPGRSGTTWVTKSLSAHPDIYMPRRKSTRYFSSNFGNGLNWYERIFNGWAGESAVGEASVGYLMNPETAFRIHERLPEARLIATLRHPVDRAYSSYGRLTAIAKKGDPNYGISFEQKLRMTPRLLEEGRYAEHLNRYLELFPRRNLLILFYEDMARDPEGFLRSIYEFLDVEPSFRSPLLQQRLNATSTKRPKSRVLYGMYRTMVRLSLFQLTNGLDALNRREPPKLDPRLRQEIIEHYYWDDIGRLEELTGRDLSEWKRSSGCIEEAV